jgi:acetyltransferase-like isoleucine patch superfamily enzyme
MYLGRGVCLAGNLHLEVPAGQGQIELAESVYIGWGSYVNTWLPGGYLRVGARTWIGAGAQLWGHEGVEIGAQCPIAPGLLVVPYQHEFGDTGRPIIEQGGTSGTVIVEDDVYLGMSVRLLAGVRVGRGAVVGAGTVVTRSLPSYAIAVGVPARVLRDRRATGGSGASPATRPQG